MLRHIHPADLPIEFGVSIDELIQAMTSDARQHIHDDEVTAFVIES